MLHVERWGDLHGEVWNLCLEGGLRVGGNSHRHVVNANHDTRPVAKTVQSRAGRTSGEQSPNLCVSQTSHIRTFDA